MTDNMEEFLSAFNHLHDALQEKNGSTDDFFTLLKELENDPIIHRYKDELHVLRKLRNLFVHEKKTIEYDLATPSRKAIEQLKFIRKQVIQPASAGEYFSREVFCFNLDDSLERLLYFVAKNHLYQFPIFDANGLTGIISHNGITNWIAHHYEEGKIDLRNRSIRDIVADEDNYYHYEIIPTKTIFFDVEEMFSKQLLFGRSQYVLLLADQKDIEKWEDIKGIITPWDLPHVFSLIQFE